MQTAKAITSGSGYRSTSAAFRKAARWLKDRLQTTEYWNATFQQLDKAGKRGGISEDALREIRKRFGIDQS